MRYREGLCFQDLGFRVQHLGEFIPFSLKEAVALTKQARADLIETAIRWLD